MAYATVSWQHLTAVLGHMTSSSRAALYGAAVMMGVAMLALVWALGMRFIAH